MDEVFDVLVPYGATPVKVGTAKLVNGKIELTFTKAMFSRYSGTIANRGLYLETPEKSPGKHSEENKEKKDE